MLYGIHVVKWLDFIRVHRLLLAQPRVVERVVAAQHLAVAKLGGRRLRTSGFERAPLSRSEPE